MADDTSEADKSGVTAGRPAVDTDVDSVTDGLVSGVSEGVGGESSQAVAASVPGLEAHRVRSHKVKPRRRWPWIVVIIILLGLLATSVAMTYEMSQRSEAWSAQVDDITYTSYELGNQVADVTAQNVQLDDQIDLLEEQLSNSKDTVLQLSDEKAQWRDDTEFAQQQVEATEQLLTTAASVANGLQRCTDGQLQLMETLASADDYAPDQLEAYQDSVTELCDNAEQANLELQRKLAE